MAAVYNENVNNDTVGLKYILTKGEDWIEMDKITAKELQRTLKVSKKRSQSQILMQNLAQQITKKKILVDLETNVKM